MSMYLAIFGKPRYLGLIDLQENFPERSPAEENGSWEPGPRETGQDWPLGSSAAPERGEWLVVDTMRGLELALLGGPLSGDQEQRYRSACSEDSSDGQVKGGEPILQEIAFVRKASEEDLKAASEEREEEDRILVKARELLRNHNLSLKLVDVEYLLDRKKLFFYFTSEQRVDFRAYVRDLAKEFKTRIEMRQIGVRDEAKTVKGIAPCGGECCCGYWLHRFTPICIKMVKEQNLALNPTKISGICGRLMCCMSFEHHMYGSLWKSLPNPGSKIRTPNGTYLVDGVDLSAEAVRVRCPEGKETFVKVEEFSGFREAVLEGREWEETVVRERRTVREEVPRPPRRKPLASPEAEGVKTPARERPQPRGQRKRPEMAASPSPVGEAGQKIPAQEKSVPAEGVQAAKKKRRRRKKPLAREGSGLQAPPLQTAENGQPNAQQGGGPGTRSGDDAQAKKRHQGQRRRRPRRDTRPESPQNPQESQ